VAGSGGAGLRAAIGALGKGSQVLLVSKGRLARSGASPMAGADLTCHGRGMRDVGFFGEPRDSEEKFLHDILHQGCLLNDQRLAELFIKDGPDRMREMLEWGMKVNYTDERAVFTPGVSIVDTLFRQARKLGVKTLEDAALLDLYTMDGRVVGALVLDLKSGNFYRIIAKAVILATGGWHKAFAVVTGSRELTGDGTAMVLRAGGELIDMEFITFACNVLYWPNVYRGSIFTYVLSLIVGGELENSLGERVFDKYDPWMIEYANRTEWNKSFISMISAREIREGNALSHGGLSFTSGDMGFETFDKKVEQYFKNWIFHDGNFIGLREKMRRGEGLEVGPGAEYVEGGIAVNDRYETSLIGLYAAGECAGSVFGANRVAAATMEMLTTGARAGWSASEYAQSVGYTEVDPLQEARLVEKALAPLRRQGVVNVVEIRKELQEQSQYRMGPVRTEHEIIDYLAFLESVKQDELPRIGIQNKSHIYNKEWLDTLDLCNMVDTMQACARAALMREESRGVHYREDFPFVDNDNWLKQILVKVENEELTLRRRMKNTCRMVPPSGKTPYMEFIKDMMKAHSDVGGHH
jgi:succinate dehydrogenase/fumarate reductase flavoprotein subunit